MGFRNARDCNPYIKNVLFKSEFSVTTKYLAWTVKGMITLLMVLGLG